MEMTIAEKVSYLKGLAEGMKLDAETNEGKLLLAILDVLGDIAINIEDIDSDLEDVTDVVTDIEESVIDLEDAVYGDDDDDCDEDEDEEMYEFTCPECNNSIAVDFSIISEGFIVCPNCGEKTELDLSALDDECDCGHCH